MPKNLPPRHVCLCLAKDALLLHGESLLSTFLTHAVFLRRHDYVSREEFGHLPPQPSIYPSVDGLKLQQEPIMTIWTGNDHQLGVRNVSCNLLLLGSGEQAV